MLTLGGQQLGADFFLVLDFCTIGFTADMGDTTESNILVVVRCRPITSKEVKTGQTDLVRVMDKKVRVRAFGRLAGSRVRAACQPEPTSFAWFRPT